MKLVHRPQRRPKMSRRDGRDARGVALIFVLTTIAILTAIAMDFTYNSRVNLELAAQSRDALRARSLAMSAMNFSRLLLRFQKQIDGATSGAAGALGGMLGNLPLGDPSAIERYSRELGMSPEQAMNVLKQITGGGAGGAAQGGAAAPSGPAIRLWDVVPIDSNAVSFVTSAFPPKEAPAPAPNSRPGGPDDGGEQIEANFGEFSGSFGAKITDENQKISVHRLAGLNQSGTPLATLIQLKAMIDDPKYDFIFQEEDANRDRVDRNDVILAMKDWVDMDETGSGLDLTNPAVPFANGFGDENGPYSRYKRRYKAKNARFDSLEELHMVYGVSDAFMAAFGDRLTVWTTSKNGKININTDDPLQMVTNILSAAANPMDPAVRDPLRLQLIMEQIKLLRRFPFIGLNVQSFLGILQSNGIQVRPEFANPNSNGNFFDDKSDTFKIVATGEAGRVKKTLTAVVRYDDGLGQLLYWHED